MRPSTVVLPAVLARPLSLGPLRPPRATPRRAHKVHGQQGKVNPRGEVAQGAYLSAALVRGAEGVDGRSGDGGPLAGGNGEIAGENHCSIVRNQIIGQDDNLQSQKVVHGQ